jgi:signal transduction histidine kinase
LLQGPRDVVLEVADQGAGIADWQSAADAGSMGVGISGMRARLHQLGGTLEIRSTRAGTTILARVPVGAADRSIWDHAGSGATATGTAAAEGRAVPLQTGASG